MILIIDNYDSFVHNLARYVRLTGKETRVIRNDAMSVAEIAALNPEAIILSPGPCRPKEAGICLDVVRELGAAMPILGVCLGHQVIGEAYGGATIRGEPCHGRASEIHHGGNDIFTGLPSPFAGGRYHSLVTQLPEGAPLTVTARDENGTIMAIAHHAYPVYGVQFHPESILSENGLALIRNFVTIAKQKQTKTAA